MTAKLWKEQKRINETQNKINRGTMMIFKLQSEIENSRRKQSDLLLLMIIVTFIFSSITFFLVA